MTSDLYLLTAFSIILLISIYFLTNLNLLLLKPIKSSITKTWPSQLADEPIPIVGIRRLSVIFFDNFVSIHSNTIENAPAFSKSYVSFKILLLSCCFFPLKVNF